MKYILIRDRYRVDRKIGEGGFGAVYAGTDLQSNEDVAIKLTYFTRDPHALETEAKAYKELAGGVGIPQVRWFGLECEYYVLIHDLLGPSLEDLFNYCAPKFSLKTILLIADQAISRIEYIHSKGYLHRDIKPHNLLMGVGRQGNLLYTVDFGLAEEYAEAKQDQSRTNIPFGGTQRYASINNHYGRPQSWGDDLESLGYVFLYFARGSLPWQGLKAPNKKERRDLVKAMKANLSGEKLCEGLLPAEFATYINYARSLGFEDKPDYAAIRENFRRLSRSKGFEYDNVYDWTVSRFVEIHRSGDKMASSNPTEALEQRPTGGQQEEVQRVADSAAEDSKGDHKGVAGKAECPWTSPTC